MVNFRKVDAALATGGTNKRTKNFNTLRVGQIGSGVYNRCVEIGPRSNPRRINFQLLFSIVERTPSMKYLLRIGKITYWS